MNWSVKNKINGFTLVELLVVVSVVAILSSIALPAYMTYSIRSRVTEGIRMSSAAKSMVIEAAAAAQDLNVTIAQWNAQAANSGIYSKYVSSILITPQGEVTITYSNAAGIVAPANTLVYSPYIRNSLGFSTALATALSNGITGTFDWACASSSAAVANSNGMLFPMLGTMTPEYAPSYCR